MEKVTPPLSSRKCAGTNVLTRVCREELEAVALYMTQLCGGMNPLMRGDLSGYMDGTSSWALPGEDAPEDSIKNVTSARTLNAMVSHAVVISSTLNKLPNFTSCHNGS